MKAEPPEDHLKKFTDQQIQNTLGSFRTAEVMIYISLNDLPLNVRGYLRKRLQILHGMLAPPKPPEEDTSELN